jgi:hypothetical protein
LTFHAILRRLGREGVLLQPVVILHPLPMFTFTTTLNLDDAMMHVQSYMTRNQGYVLTHRDQTTLTFEKTQKPSALTFLILLLFFVLPAILYLILAWKKKTASAYFKKEKEGTKVMVEGILGRLLAKHLAQYDVTLKALPEARFSLFWDVSPVYVVAGGAAIFMLFILLLKGVGAF